MCIEACGAPETFLNCIDCAAFAANIILIGNGKRETSFVHSILLKKELNVFGSRNALKDDFIKALSIADKVILTPIMGSREVNTYGIYTSQLAEKIPGSVWFNTFDEVAQYVVDNAESGDLVITLGCGDIYKAAKIMINMLKETQ